MLALKCSNRRLTTDLYRLQVFDADPSGAVIVLPFDEDLKDALLTHTRLPDPGDDS